MPVGSPRRPLLDLGTAPVLMIGVTGHRDLRSEDILLLTERVKEKLQTLRVEFPEARLILLSALAEGADQLVARVAVDDLGLELVVPLPFPVEVYRNELISQEDQASFDELLGKAAAHFVVPAVEDASGAPITDANLAFAALGRVIASSSDILLTLWDGEPSEKMGGTAQVVRYMRTGHGLPSSLARLGSLVNSPEHAIIYHLGTPRQQHPNIVQPCVWREPIFVSGSKSELDAFGKLHGLLAKMDRREDFAWLSRKKNKKKVEQSIQYLGIPDELLSLPRISSLLLRYAEADTLALRFQKITYQTFRIIFQLAVVSTLLVSAYWNWGDPEFTHLLGASWWRFPEKFHLFVVGHAFLLAAAFSIYAWFRYWPRTLCHANRQHKHLDYRALAEALRVQIFWRLGGLNDSVSEKYLRRHHSPLDWIKSALRLAYLDACIDGAAASPPQINTVIKYWVLGQATYQRDKRLERDENRLHRLERISRACFITGVLILSYECFHVAEPSFQRNVIIFLAGLLPVLAGLFEFYLRVQGYKDHTHEARKMATIFLNAHRALWYLQRSHAFASYPDGERNLPEIFLTADEPHIVRIAQDILREAGTEALEENCDWLLMHRSREIEVPG